MLPALTGVYGNAASLHYYGQMARQRVDEARREVAAWLGARPEEIAFTSGGTESDQLAVVGQAHVVTTTVEHRAVLDAARQNQHATLVRVDSRGLVDPDDIRKALRPGASPRVSLISVMHANNELGTIQPIETISRIAREEGMPLHSDGVQASGKIPVNVREMGVSMYSIAAHKIYGPKGVGALFNKHKPAPRRHGECGGRAGTGSGLALGDGAWETGGLACKSVAGPAGGRLCWTAFRRLHERRGAPRVPNTSNLRFEGIDAEPLLIALDLRGFAVSSGSACSSGATEPSHVLQAIGLSKQQARSSLRVSLGRSNDAAQVDALVDALAEGVAHLRALHRDGARVCLTPLQP